MLFDRDLGIYSDGTYSGDEWKEIVNNTVTSELADILFDKEMYTKRKFYDFVRDREYKINIRLLFSMYVSRFEFNINVNFDDVILRQGFMINV